MSLTGITPGDIVLVDGYYAHVLDRERGRLKVRWLKTTSERWVKAGEVEGFWKRKR